MPDIARIQKEIAAAGCDGWLLCDFHNRDKIAYQVLGLDFGKFTSRRWYYWIPARGQPVRLCSKVEPARLADLLQRGLIEVAGQAEPLVPAQHGEQIFNPGVPGAAGGMHALDRPGAVDGQVLGGEILQFVRKMPPCDRRRPPRRPPAQLRLEQVGEPES